MRSLFRINDSLIGKKVYIWETNQVSLLLMTVMLQNDIYVSGFISDRDHDIQIMNKPIVSLSQIEAERSKIVIIMAGKKNAEIGEQLEKKGYVVYYDFNFSAYEGDCIFLGSY